MAGGGAIIEQEEGLHVKYLLENYKEMKFAERVFGEKNQDLVFLEHCLSCLESYERDLLEKLYLEGISLRKYAAVSGFSRNFIAKERDKLLGLLTKFFKIKKACNTKEA